MSLVNVRHYDVVSSSGGVLNAFSLYRSVSKLTASSTDDEIACIHGVRGLATIALLVAHKFLPVAVMPYTNRLKITEVRFAFLLIADSLSKPTEKMYRLYLVG
jgi:hypothetical protein